MTQDAYAAAGVSQSEADEAVAALVRSLGAIDTGKEQRTVSLPGHYASVLRLDGEAGIALCTDGVGTKLLIAEQLGRWDTVGIDCVAMNVNDLICVGAEPLAQVDYIAVPKVEKDVLGDLGIGLKDGAEQAGIEIPGGEIAQLGGMVNGLDLSAAAIGVVRLDSIVIGNRVEPGDAIIGIPSSGLHSNGYTLARRALAEVPLDDERLGAPLGEILLEPTTIYVRAVMELLRSEVDVRGLAHITGDGLNNLKRLRDDVLYVIDEPLPAQPIFGLIQQLGQVSDEEMAEVFNMGCGFCVVVPEADAEAAVELLAAHHEGTRRIGSVAAPG
jgi:phosphoribosylformylglycinamidine cyclo-ligase